MREELATNPVENAPFREEVLEQIHEVAERITERVRHVLPAGVALDTWADAEPTSGRPLAGSGRLGATPDTAAAVDSPPRQA